MLKLKLVTPPTLEPVTKEQIKTQLKFDLDDDTPDNDINDLLPAARQWCETHHNRAYMMQTFELALDEWPLGDRIKLPRPKLLSIESLEYTAADGTSETWDAANYIKDDFSDPGYLVAVKPWPSSKLAPNGLIVQYKAGYGDKPEDVPAVIRQAIILLVCYWYDNGYSDPPQAVLSLLSLDRVVPL